MKTMIDNFDVQYARLALDEAWDKYLEECAINGIPSLPYSVWVRENCSNDSKR